MKTSKCPLWLLGLSVYLIGLGGCGDADPRSTVSGAVTLDGENVPHGEIVLVPTTPTTPSEAGRILNGAYTMRAAPGEKKVIIRAEREHPTDKVPGPDPGTMVPRREQFIPSRYNESTELTLEVSSGRNAKNFELSSD